MANDDPVKIPLHINGNDPVGFDSPLLGDASANDNLRAIAAHVQRRHQVSENVNNSRLCNGNRLGGVLFEQRALTRGTRLRLSRLCPPKERSPKRSII
jgi:hypothetical protein